MAEIPQSFRALVLEQESSPDGRIVHELRTLPTSALPSGPEDNVLVQVAYSDFNYKDGLAILNRNKVVRSFPMVPGIDFAGTVLESGSADFAPGDRVVLTGWGVGERHWGGFAQLARVRSEWLVRLPEGLSLEEAMRMGTAGVTAMLALMALETLGLTPDTGEVLVTGASGGVGGEAVALLAHLGYTVAAATRRTDQQDYLCSLGAKEIVDSATLTAPGGPLGSARWWGAIDTVGGDVLAGVLRTMQHAASIASCGNAGGIELHTSVLPFILRGNNLLGIDSLPVPREVRQVVWERLAREMPRDVLARMTRVEPLEAAARLAEEILAGRVRGHVVIDVNA